MSQEAINRKQIGRINVDSGQLFIVDPCYLDKWMPGDFTGEEDEPTNSYAHVTTFMLENNHGEVEKGIVVSLDSDGTYPVFVVEDEEGYILRIEIDLEAGARLLRSMLAK